MSPVDSYLDFVDPVAVDSYLDFVDPVAVQPGEIREVSARHQSVAFRFAALRTRASAPWRVLSVRVGGYEVINNVVGSPIDVDALNELIRLGLIKPITAQTAMDVVLLIQNRAAFPLVFEGRLLGVAAV